MTGETVVLEEKTLPRASLFINAAWAATGFNTDCCSEKPAINPLSRGGAFWW